MPSKPLHGSKVKQTVGIDPELYAWVKEQINRHVFASVPHAVNRALADLKERMGSTK